MNKQSFAQVVASLARGPIRALRLNGSDDANARTNMIAGIENLKSKIQNKRAGQKHGRLVRHYFLISLVLISGGLITSGLSELYFRNRESAADLVRLQQEITSGA